MTYQSFGQSLAVLAVAGAFTVTAPAWAQVAGGTTTVEASIVQSTQIAMGWSVRKTLMGKAIYNENGDRIGKVADLIISPESNVSYVIVGAGGFVGIGRHDVAIPVNRIQDKAGRLVMAGATKDMIKSMPRFTYTDDTSRRDEFVAAADKDIARGRAMVVDLEKKAGTVAADAKAGIDLRITNLQVDVKSAEAKVDELKQAAAVRWHEFEAGVNAATARLRKSLDTKAG